MASQETQMAGLPEGIQIQTPDGKPPTPEQIMNINKQLAADAAKNGMTVPQFIAKMKEQANAQKAAQAQIAIEAEKAGMTVPEFIEKMKAAQAAQQQAQAQAQAQQQQQPINPGPPNPAAIAVAKFLKSQDLKTRTCILQGQRKDMFKGKLLESPFDVSMT
jgi:translocation protein SEC62